ncbi:MAG TPA: hypothetical protein VIY49_31695 [Bryobacteraceae bacterium]
MMWHWLRLPPVTFRGRHAPPAVESIADLEMQAVLARLAQAEAELRLVCLRKDWGEEIRKAEERLQDAEICVRAIRRSRLLSV